MNNTSLSAETLVAQAFGEIDPVSGALTPPINLSTNFEQAPDGSYHQDRVYSRADNPTYEIPERLLAALEGDGCSCILLASGMAAALSVATPRKRIRKWGSAIFVSGCTSILSPAKATAK